jgi:hypothetical protein
MVAARAPMPSTKTAVNKAKIARIGNAQMSLSFEVVDSIKFLNLQSKELIFYK